MREMPSLPLFYTVYTYAVSVDIKGINFGPIFEPSDRFNNVYELVHPFRTGNHFG